MSDSGLCKVRRWMAGVHIARDMIMIALEKWSRISLAVNLVNALVVYVGAMRAIQFMHDCQ
ncbi:hypothetical protein L218DRAFT_490183 [Marasmius fiardii PR-910]|nr:hypothetical protein L218DRAFT_490183 [Marasmius fiardii PR-910]